MEILESWMYGDPLDVMDRLRKAREAARKQAERDRLHKGRRIRALVKQAMKGGKR